MEQVRYGEFIAGIVQNMSFKSAIRTEDIAAQLADKGEIEWLQKGADCLVKQTAFGKATPDIDQMVMKTLTEQDGAKIGYESGAFLFNKLGLTTLVPRHIDAAKSTRFWLPARTGLSKRAFTQG